MKRRMYWLLPRETRHNVLHLSGFTFRNICLKFELICRDCGLSASDGRRRAAPRCRPVAPARRGPKNPSAAGSGLRLDRGEGRLSCLLRSLADRFVRLSGKRATGGVRAIRFALVYIGRATGALFSRYQPFRLKIVLAAVATRVGAGGWEGEER